MRTVPTVLACLLLAGTLSADVYYLKDGGKVEGTGQDLGDRVLIAVPLGSITVQKSEIVRVVRRKSIVDLYREKLARTTHSAEERWKLALWCEAAGLNKEARRHLEQVIALDPDHAGARARLGYHRAGNRWLTDDEHHEWKGEIRFRGRWMPADTVAAILQAEALQARLAARGAAAGAQGQPAGAGAGAVAGNNQNNNNNKGGAANKGGGKPGLLLTHSLRPSQGFLDKYFVTNPFNYGSAGARIGYGAQYDPAAGAYYYGPVYHGPYRYDGVAQSGTGITYYGGGGYFGGYTPLGSSGASGGGLDLGYTIGQPGDRFFLGGNLHAGSSSGFGGSSEFVGHSFFGSFRAGKSRVSFRFR